MPARKGVKWLRALASIGLAMVQARALLRELRPDVVIGTGGYASVCVLKAAIRFGVPTLIHDMDAHPGRANRMLARGVTRATVGFAAAAAKLGRDDVDVPGNPLRREFFEADGSRARERLGLGPDRPLVLVYGGSRGAVALNQAGVACAADVLEAGADLLIVTGRGNLEATESAVSQLPADARAGVRLLEYVETGMADLRAASAVAVCRSGGATVFELAATGLPGILVPYPYSMEQHQRANAQAYADAGAGVVLDQSEVERPGVLAGLLSDLLKNTDRLNRMREAAREFARPKAAEDIARIALSLAGERKG